MGARLLWGSVECVEAIVSATYLATVTISPNARCIVNHDDFISRYRMTNLGRDKVLRDI